MKSDTGKRKAAQLYTDATDAKSVIWVCQISVFMMWERYCCKPPGV